MLRLFTFCQIFILFFIKKRKLKKNYSLRLFYEIYRRRANDLHNNIVIVVIIKETINQRDVSLLNSFYHYFTADCY